MSTELHYFIIDLRFDEDRHLYTNHSGLFETVLRDWAHTDRPFHLHRLECYPGLVPGLPGFVSAIITTDPILTRPQRDGAFQQIDTIFRRRLIDREES